MINESTIATYFDNDRALFTRFVQRFTEQVPTDVAAITQAILAPDMAAAAMAIHTLKGQLRYLGQTDLADQLQRLESLADAQDTTAVAAGWSTFATAFVPVLADLTRFGEGEQ